MFDEMMPGAPPGEPPMGPPEQEINLPTTAKVVKIEGSNVMISTDQGEKITLPIEAFIFPPTEGASLVQAEVLRVEGETMTIKVAEEEITVPVKEGFNEGDLFWMPAPPMGPAEERPMAAEGQVLF